MTLSTKTKAKPDYKDVKEVGDYLVAKSKPDEYIGYEGFYTFARNYAALWFWARARFVGVKDKDIEDLLCSGLWRAITQADAEERTSPKCVAGDALRIFLNLKCNPKANS